MKYAIGILLGVASFAWLFSVCSPAGKNKTGHEYMPDMYHSVGYEANVLTNYSWNHWDNESSFKKAELSQPRNIVEGSVPRGMTAVHYAGAAQLDLVRGKNASNAIAAQPNGHVPFYYENTEGERARCEKELAGNPFPITKSGLDRAKPLYETFCGICHGNDGGGNGALVATEKYPAQPKNLVADDMISAGNGRYYFAMVYGKNVMGGYTDKISYEERWQVIHYVRALQAKAKKLEYTEKANTLSNIEQPAKGVASGPARAGNTVIPPLAAN